MGFSEGGNSDEDMYFTSATPPEVVVNGKRAYRFALKTGTLELNPEFVVDGEKGIDDLVELIGPFPTQGANFSYPLLYGAGAVFNGVKAIVYLPLEDRTVHP